MRADEMRMAAPFIVGGFGLIPFILGLIMLFKGSRLCAEPLPVEDIAPDRMEDRKRILEMLAEGKITNAEADRLLAEVSAVNPGGKQPFAVRYRLVVNWPRWIAGFVLLIFAFWAFSICFQYINVAAGNPLGVHWGLFSSTGRHSTEFLLLQPRVMSGGFLGLAFLISVVLFAFAILGFWLWMLADCICRPANAFPNLFSPSPERKGVKIFWVILLLLLHLLAAIVYYFAVYRSPYTSGSNPGVNSANLKPC